MSANAPMPPQSGPGGTQPIGDGGAGGYPPQPGAYQQGPPPGYGQQQYPGQQPGVGDRAADMMQNVGRHIRTPETKPFFMTSEFLVWLITVISLVIAGAVVGSGDHGDVLRANLVWILFTAISFAYIISRGISKAGTKYRDRDGGGRDGYRGY
jgi:hypothetical protein